nr:hypothetical protein [Clostridium sporogenes]
MLVFNFKVSVSIFFNLEYINIVNNFIGVNMMYPYFYYFYYDNYMRGPAPPPMPPFMTPPGGFSPQGGPPSTPPPNIPPTKPSKSGPNVKAVDPGSIRFCRYKFTYIWPSRGKPFWMWIVYVGNKSISGWKWTGYNWAYAGIDLNRIDSFQCY